VRFVFIFLINDCNNIILTKQMVTRFKMYAALMQKYVPSLCIDSQTSCFQRRTYYRGKNFQQFIVLSLISCEWKGSI